MLVCLPGRIRSSIFRTALFLFMIVKYQIDWKNEGPRRQSDLRPMTGFFWRNETAVRLGCHSSLNAEL